MPEEENEASAPYNLESEDLRVNLQHYDKRDKEEIEKKKQGQEAGQHKHVSERSY